MEKAGKRLNRKNRVISRELFKKQLMRRIASLAREKDKAKEAKGWLDIYTRVRL